MSSKLFHFLRMSIWLNQALIIYLCLSKSIRLNTLSWNSLYFFCYVCISRHASQIYFILSATRCLSHACYNSLFRSCISSNFRNPLKAVYFKICPRICFPIRTSFLSCFQALKNTNLLVRLTFPLTFMTNLICALFALAIYFHSLTTMASTPGLSLFFLHFISSLILSLSILKPFINLFERIFFLKSVYFTVFASTSVKKVCLRCVNIAFLCFQLLRNNYLLSVTNISFFLPSSSPRIESNTFLFSLIP